ncbi:MAG: 3-hydroxyacyl-CoA dehydrogenase NAD-binding domain-containing protein [Flavobacteriales bacterium]|nr:3-hydroxyacyl-CoA dehydrogenase NAD-binding domain-containing protein [Flavobacteriales bacterium]
MLKIGVIGAGSMGSGIAEVAATFGHSVIIYDNAIGARDKFENGLQRNFQKLIEKGKMTNETAREITERILFVQRLQDVGESDLVIEAVVEDIKVKKDIFSELEQVCGHETILATNTSSLSVTSIAAACKYPERVLGIHFFNPATLMPLVEIIPGIATQEIVVQQARELIDSWNKVTVLAKDTPGFIVNRIARPFYGEAIRILEEGLATKEEIDTTMKKWGGFRMGPFELMDFIGNDVNYAVTETVFREFWFDPRYKPSFTQKRLVEAGFLGRKSGRGYYDYVNGKGPVEVEVNEEKALEILNRILAMLINEAADALYLGIANKEDIDLSMTKGVNYPKGLLKWADEIGISKVYQTLLNLYETYCEDRYRPSPILRRMAKNNQRFYA